jgi:hypothetical protein
MTTPYSTLHPVLPLGQQPGCEDEPVNLAMESVAGEEDPGAAMDQVTAPRPGSRRRHETQKDSERPGPVRR